MSVAVGRSVCVVPPPCPHGGGGHGTQILSLERFPPRRVSGWGKDALSDIRGGGGTHSRYFKGKRQTATPRCFEGAVKKHRRPPPPPLFFWRVEHFDYFFLLKVLPPPPPKSPKKQQFCPNAPPPFNFPTRLRNNLIFPHSAPAGGGGWVCIDV